MVEVCINNTWGAVCPNSFGESEASVVCRQLGFISQSQQVLIGFPGSGPILFPPGSVPIYLAGIDCNGTEESLLQCPLAEEIEECQFFLEAGLLCPGKKTNIGLSVNAIGF